MEEGEILEEEHQPPAPAAASPKVVPIKASKSWKVIYKRSFSGCSPLEDYRLLEKCGEGTFGEVHMAKNRKTGEIVALKRIFAHGQQKDGFHVTALREIKFLKWLSHPNIIPISDIAYSTKSSNQSSSSGEIDCFYIVFPYMEHDLAGLLGNKQLSFTIPQMKYYMKEILKGCAYLHAKKIMHRDIKSANILLDNAGRVALADFGLAQQFCEARKDYTPGVVTRWYRPPELLLGSNSYTPAVDMWGIGCIFGEFFLRKPIFLGTSELHQLELICQAVGIPNERNWPGVCSLPMWKSVNFSNLQADDTGGDCERKFKECWTKHSGSRAFGDLMSKLLQLNPLRRISAQEALEHEYFCEIPWPAKRTDLPRYRSCHEIDVKRANQADLQQANSHSTSRKRFYSQESSEAEVPRRDFHRGNLKPFSSSKREESTTTQRPSHPHRL